MNRYYIQLIDKQGKIWNSDLIETHYTPMQMWLSVAGFQTDTLVWRLTDLNGKLLLETAKSAKSWLIIGGSAFDTRRNADWCEAAQ